MLLKILVISHKMYDCHLEWRVVKIQINEPAESCEMEQKRSFMARTYLNGYYQVK